MYLLVLFLFIPETLGTGASPRCGGTFTAARGVLSTPNFPKKFTTPIHCQWIIDAQDAAQNSSIIVYLTQLYVFEGLSFKEYKFYIDNFRVPGDVIYSVTEETVSNVSFVQCYTNYLVITLNLSSIEGTHLRVLDRLLDVYGFNITYEITNRAVREDRCTMETCGFTGNCHDHYTHFSCDCFPGYKGKRCSEGEKSRCLFCKNGGTCTHIGDLVVTCECAPGFIGRFCDHPVSKLPQNKGCEDCLISCPFDGTLENVCKCPKIQSGLASNDSIGFSSTVVIANVTTKNSNGENELRTHLGKYITRLLRVNSSIGDVQIPYLKLQSDGVEVTFRFYGLKRDERRIRAVINRWAQHGAIGNISLVEKDIILTTDPYLYLKNVSNNKNGVIRVNEDFILTCEARGSRYMIFRWFKDGMLIYKSPSISNKWTKLITAEGSKDHYTAILAVEKAGKLDEGVFTCQVEDYGLQQCRSRRVSLRHPPSIRLDPISLTIDKGEPFNIKCLSVVDHPRQYIYSWTKDNLLLPKKTDTEHYEILYKVGSILQVNGLNKSASYSCLVQDGNVSSKTTIIVNVIDRSVVTPCESTDLEGFTWPVTAPGTDYKQNCPNSYSGISSRSCIMLEDGKPKWLLPDYSNCTAFDLLLPINNFRSLLQGYEQTTPLDVLANIANYVTNKTLLRGEGSVILDLVFKISVYNNISRFSQMEDVTSIILDIVDVILNQTQSLNKEQQVLRLQKIVKSQLVSFGKSLEITNYQKNLKNVIVAIEEFSPGYNFYKPITIMRVVYKNLYKFLLPNSIIRLSDDREIEYRIISDIVGIWLSNDEETKHYDTIFPHEVIGDRTDWNLMCSLANFASSNYAWDTNVCYSKAQNLTATTCSCTKQGTMALLLVKEPKTVSHESQRHQNTVILIGCSTCLVISSICAIVLLFNWIYHRSSFTFVKLQCCISISGTMVMFIVAFCNNLPKEFYLYIVSFLQVFFFMGMSSQLSTLLIIYSELVELQNKDSLKLTVVGIITGAPLIVVFGNHLAHKTMDIHLNYWWLLKGSLSFNVFTGCTVIIFILFIVLYYLVIKLIIGDKTMATKFLKNRSSLVKNTSVLFFSIIVLAVVSIACVNNLKDPIWHYIFASLSILTASLQVICLICNSSDFLIRKRLMERFKTKKLESSSPQKSDSEDSENPAELNSSPNKSDFSPIEQYNSSPTQFNLISKSNSLSSPDILGTKVFVELDLVASSLQSAVNRPNSARLAISKAFDEPLKVVETLSDKFCDTDKVEHMDAVMDGISNDLNYLLNGHIEFKTT